MTPRALVFSSRDSMQFVAARDLAKATGAQLVDRLSNRMEDLLLVARHKVIEPVAVVIVDETDTVLARIPRLITATTLNKLLGAE